MYGVGPSVGLRTTSRSVNPPRPRASLMPPPSAISKCMKISVVPVSCSPVKSVPIFDVACSATVRKLFGPLYLASNDGCHCMMMLSCPETHQREVCECGNMVSKGSSGGESDVADGVAPAACAQLLVVTASSDARPKTVSHLVGSAVCGMWVMDWRCVFVASICCLSVYL